MKRALNVVNFVSLKENDHIVIFRPNSKKLVFMGKLSKREFTNSTPNNRIVAVLTHPDGTTYGLTAHSIRQNLYDYEKGRIFVMNDSLFI